MSRQTKNTEDYYAKCSNQRERFIHLMMEKPGLFINPMSGVNAELINLIEKAIDEECFSLSMVAGLDRGIQTCILEYLNADPNQRYSAHGTNPLFKITLKNISSETLQIKTGKRQIRKNNSRPGTGVDGKGYTEIAKPQYATLLPGETIAFELSAGRALSLLQTYSRYVWSEEYADSHTNISSYDRLVEVSGSMTFYSRGRNQYNLSSHIPVEKTWTFEGKVKA